MCQLERCTASGITSTKYSSAPVYGEVAISPYLMNNEVCLNKIGAAKTASSSILVDQKESVPVLDAAEGD